MSVTINTTVYHWLRELKLPVSKTFIKQQLLSHPDYPSLLSITDTLHDLGVENTALQIEKEQLPEMPLPFIAHLNGNGGEFVIVKRSNDLEKYFPGFFSRWGGVVIAAEKPEDWNNKQNKEWLKKDNNNSFAVASALSLLALFIVLSAVFSFSWTYTGLLLIAIAGVFVSWMIVSKDLGIENKIADEFCRGNEGCSSVIHSNTVKLPFNLGWSDVAVIYFSFLLFTLLAGSFIGILSAIYALMTMLTFVAMPVSIVSIFYQWRVIKKWCKLCLITSALLWLQFFLLLPVSTGIFENGIDNSMIIVATAAALFLLFIAAGWLWIRSLIGENKEMKAENLAAKRFRRNPDIFKALLEKQKRITVSPDGLGITIGNPAATNIIIKVCNPYCGPCAKAHPIIERLFEQNENLKGQIIFTAEGDEKDLKTKPVRHLMALNEKNNRQLIQEALDDWYMADEKDYDSFANKYILNGELEKQDEKLKAMKKWCDEVKIEFTPTYFVNGYQLPKQYKIEELKYFF